MLLLLAASDLILILICFSFCRPLSPSIGNFNNNAMSKNDMKHPMSAPSPLAFTPTSVLKKMNAEKDGEQKIGMYSSKSSCSAGKSENPLS